MEEKYSLSYYRAGNIIEPITEEQEGFFFFTKKTKSQICELQKLIKDDVYGCYLVAGMRGIGKTSFINVALSNSENYPYGKKGIIVRLNAIQISNVKELFPVLVEELLHLSENSSDILKTFHEKLRKIDFLNRGNMKICIQGGGAFEHVEGTSNAITKEMKTGFDIESITKLPFKLNSILSGEEKKQTNTNITANIKRDFEYETHEKPYELFRELLNELENCRFRLILVLDEIDKCEETFIKEVFAQYKDFLTNYKLFCFFITDESIYKDCIKSKNNIFATYFIKMFYLPLLSYQETMRYCFEHYCEKEISSVDILYYLSLGNTRLLNINYNTFLKVDFLKIEYVVLLYKAKLFQYIIENVQYEFDMEDIRSLKKDMLKTDIKALIEYIFDGGGCLTSVATDYYNSIKANRYPEAKEILECMQKYNDKFGMQIINFRDDKISLCYQSNIRIFVADGSLEICYDKDNTMAYNNRIGIKELFPFYEKGMKPYANGGGLIHLIKLGNNEPYAYRNAMEHILISNYFSIDKLIWIKRMRDGGWYTDEEYSLLAVIDKGIGKRYAYYNEAGSYSSEESGNVTNLLKKMSDMGLNYSEKVFDKGESLEEIVLQIVGSLR